ncbi:4724_t:CDS:2, partial [Scutellospora calospora]
VSPEISSLRETAPSILLSHISNSNDEDENKNNSINTMLSDDDEYAGYYYDLASKNKTEISKEVSRTSSVSQKYEKQTLPSRRINGDVSSNSDTSNSISSNYSISTSEIEVIYKTEAVRKYPILKRKDGIIKGKKIIELGLCSECDNDILISPLKAFTYLACEYLFHRLCIEKKLLLTVPNICPFLDCRKNVEILDQANLLGTVSNLPLTNPKEASQSTGISLLMGETFVLSSLLIWIPPIRMEGIENTATQQVKSNLRYAKCSEDLSSCLLPIGFLQFSLQLQSLLKLLIYLTCKHIIHYNCIDNQQKLCPICPSTNMELEEEEEMSIDGEEQPNTSSKKRSNEGTDVNSSSPKKNTKKAVRKEDSSILKKLIKELSALILQQSSSGSIISLQTFPDMDISSVNFRKLDNKIINAED